MLRSISGPFPKFLRAVLRIPSPPQRHPRSCPVTSRAAPRGLSTSSVWATLRPAGAVRMGTGGEEAASAAALSTLPSVTLLCILLQRSECGAGVPCSHEVSPPSRPWPQRATTRVTLSRARDLEHSHCVIIVGSRVGRNGVHADVCEGCAVRH